jgi:3-oxoacyl-[acyl-carrier-protein] synthase-3
MSTILTPRDTLVAAPARAATRRPQLRGAAIASVAMSLPAQVVSNQEIAERLGVSTDWIERRTGVRNRRRAAEHERLDAHAVRAAREALERAGVSAAEVDLVLVATTTADEILPNAAPLVAHGLGATRAGAFDVGAACTGFLSAMAVGCGQIEAGRANCVVVIGADFMSRIIDPDDRSTASVFGDGAGAVVLSATDEPSRIGPILLSADGGGAEYIFVERDESRVRMRGHETFREAVAWLSESTISAVAAAGLELEQIDRFVYHQANGRILTAVGERLGLDPERVVECIGEYGNTSAGTLPMALAHCESEGGLHPGDKVLVAAFGAGFTWGATVVEWGTP